MDIQGLKDRLQDAIRYAQLMHKVEPNNQYWTGKIDGINCATGLIMLAEAGESIDLSDAMTEEELAEVEA